MSWSKLSNPRMKTKADQELVSIIRNGGLSHAAARHELRARGKESQVWEVDQEFLDTQRR